MNRKIAGIICLILSVSLLFTACESIQTVSTPLNSEASSQLISNSEDLSYKGDTFTVLNDNTPTFNDTKTEVESFERYSDLDELGRCGVAEACIGIDLMPTEDRGAIGQIKPSGWHTVKYDIVDGKYLYNRCHLIGFQLTGENANEKNLITGTRYFNVEGMLPFENMVADYVKETENHVMYKVTPVYDGDNLVAKGVIMEAYSVEDKGEGISFNVFVHNVQPGIVIDYKTGESRLADNYEESSEESSDDTASKDENSKTPSTSVTVYVLNLSSKKFHYQSCHNAEKIKAENRKESTDSRDNIIKDGYTPCKTCNP